MIQICKLIIELHDLDYRLRCLNGSRTPPRPIRRRFPRDFSITAFPLSLTTFLKYYSTFWWKSEVILLPDLWPYIPVCTKPKMLRLGELEEHLARFQFCPQSRSHYLGAILELPSCNGTPLSPSKGRHLELDVLLDEWKESLFQTFLQVSVAIHRFIGGPWLRCVPVLI